jgi:hypothetical protein
MKTAHNNDCGGDGKPTEGWPDLERLDSEKVSLFNGIYLCERTRKKQ